MLHRNRQLPRIEQEWRRYADERLPKLLSEAQWTETQAAFMAGAEAMFMAITDDFLKNDLRVRRRWRLW
jgi:hypothetical protein